MKRWKVVAIFSLLGIFALALSFYLRFPAELCRTVVSATIAERFPSWRTSVGACAPLFPPGILLSHVTFAPPGTEAELVIKRIVIKPKPSFLWGKCAFDITAVALDGEVKGQGQISNPPGGEIEMRSLNLNNTVLKTLLGREIRGKLDGRLMIKSRGPSRMALKVTQGFYPLSLPGWTELEIHELEGEVSFEKEAILLEKMKIIGPSFRGHLKGEVITNWQDIKSSRLALSVEVESSQLGKTLSTVQGSIGYPIVTPFSVAK